MGFRIERCAAAVLVSCGMAFGQATTAPTVEAHPTTIPARNGNGKHITSQPAGIMLNFNNASVDTVLDELSAVAGYIVVKEVKPEGRVTLISAKPVTREEAIPLLNTCLLY